MASDDDLAQAAERALAYLRCGAGFTDKNGRCANSKCAYCDLRSAIKYIRGRNQTGER